MTASRPDPVEFRTPGREILRAWGDLWIQWLLLIGNHDLLLALIELLHPQLHADIDPDEIQRQERLLYRSDLRKLENDAFYLAGLKSHVPQRRPRTPVALLLEHKGSVDYRTPVQCLTYLVEHWDRQCPDDVASGQVSDIRLSPGLVIRLYTGRRPWIVPRELSELMGGPEYLQPTGQLWREVELDLVRFPTDSLRALDRPIGLALMLMQVSQRGRQLFRKTLREVQRGLERTAQADPVRTLDVIWAVISELYHRRSPEEYCELAPGIFAWARRVLPAAEGEVDNMVRTMADVHREEGKEQGIEIGKERGIEIGKERGIEIGKEQGIEIGKERGMRELILQGIRDKFGALSESAEAALRELQAREALPAAFQALLVAATPEEFLARLRAATPSGPGAT